MICAIGWTGDWAADVYRTDAEVRMRAGMVRTHLKLLPGEEIRSPSVVLLFWADEPIQGHNLWRRFVLAHHAPQKGGKPARVPVCFGTWGGNYAKNHIAHGQWWKDHNLAIDFLWIDAGWYGKDEPKLGANVFNSHWGELVGDWFPNPGYFPEGLGPVGKALKQMDMGFLLWFEPERVFQGTTWSREHPDYLLGPVGPNYLYNLGNPAARQALTDQLVKVINEGNISCYRQDFNFDPHPYWDKADAPDRVGMTEIGHITGLYRMWDDLLTRCPGLLIDNCASGGRRIDIETMSRSIPLWRSDLPCYPGYSGATIQNETHGLGLWAPLNSGVCDREDTYMFRMRDGARPVLRDARFRERHEQTFCHRLDPQEVRRVESGPRPVPGRLLSAHGVHGCGRRLGRLAIRSSRLEVGGRACLSPDGQPVCQRHAQPARSRARCRLSPDQPRHGQDDGSDRPPIGRAGPAHHD